MCTVILWLVVRASVSAVVRPATPALEGRSVIATGDIAGCQLVPDYNDEERSLDMVRAGGGIVLSMSDFIKLHQ